MSRTSQPSPDATLAQADGVPVTSGNPRQIEEGLIRFAPTIVNLPRGPGRLKMRADRTELRSMYPLHGAFPQV